MSKLFNIQDGGGVGDEMVGGDVDVLKIPFSTSGKDVVTEIINKIDDSNYNDFEKSLIIEPNDLKKKQNENIEQWKERMKNYINNNSERKQGQDSYQKREAIYNEIQNFLKNEKTNANTTEQPPITTDDASQGATTVKQGATTGTPGATGCIHIGIIDEAGTFVGVKSITNTESELFTKLSVIATDLKEKIKNQINETQSVATIYDQFVNTTPANCVPTFITGYDTKFFNSDELKNMFNKTPDNDKLPFTLKISISSSDSSTTVP